MAEAAEEIQNLDEDSLLPSQDNKLVDEKVSANSFVRIKILGRSTYARFLRLRDYDVFVAVDGKRLFGDIDKFKEMLKTKNDKPVSLLCTIYREDATRHGEFFEIFVEDYLGCEFEYTYKSQSDTIIDKYRNYKTGNVKDYKRYEALRNIKRHISIYDLEKSHLATLFPLFWVINKRMWEPIAIITMTYIATFLINPLLFFIVYIMISVYFHRSHVSLVRGYSLFTEHYFWMTFAARTEKEAQQICRKFDPRCTFSHSYVGAPSKEVAREKVNVRDLKQEILEEMIQEREKTKDTNEETQEDLATEIEKT